MNKMYVVKNQHGLFADKHKEWVDGREPKLLFRSEHKDEAINMVFELSSKDIHTRAETIEVELDSHKHPIVEVTAPPPPATENQLTESLADELEAAEDSEQTLVLTASDQHITEKAVT